LMTKLPLDISENFFYSSQNLKLALGENKNVLEKFVLKETLDENGVREYQITIKELTIEFSKQTRKLYEPIIMNEALAKYTENKFIALQTNLNIKPAQLMKFIKNNPISKIKERKKRINDYLIIGEEFRDKSPQVLKSFTSADSELVRTMLGLLSKLKENEIKFIRNIDMYDIITTDITKSQADALLDIVGHTANQGNPLVTMIVEIVEKGAIDRLLKLEALVMSPSWETGHILTEINNFINDLGEVFFKEPLIKIKKIGNEKSGVVKFLYKAKDGLTNSHIEVTPNNADFPN
jgi:hypothetical protein